MPERKILILTNRVPYPLKDGGNLAMKAMIDGYKANGWQVFLLSMNTSRHHLSQDVLDRLYKDIAGFETVEVDNRVKLISTLRNFLFSKEPEHAARFRNFAYGQKLIEVISSFQPNVIQVESVFLSTYLPLINKEADAYTVLRLHNIEYQVWQRLAGETAYPLKKVYLRSLAKRIKAFEERVWGMFDLLLPITEADSQIVQDVLPDAERYVVPFGIDVSKLNRHSAHERWEAYHIGAMDWLPNREGVDWFLDAVWPQLHLQIPELRFSFAGRNMPSSYMDIQIDGVTCMGEVADAGLFIADKKILIVPISSGGGIRVKILEAMAIGKVVVSTAIGMQGIEAVDKVHYLKADTAEEFVAAIKWCVEHKEQASRIGENASELVANKYNSAFIAAGLSAKLSEKEA